MKELQPMSLVTCTRIIVVCEWMTIEHIAAEMIIDNGKDTSELWVLNAPEFLPQFFLLPLMHENYLTLIRK